MRMKPTIAERNKQLVLTAFDALFNRRDDDVASTMWSEDYIQHSTHIAPSRAGLFDRARSLPALRYENALVVAEGDYVVEATADESKSGLPMFGTRFFVG
jgi:predicted SnoaL-like aldol condensation-catalyzing enzyme